MANFSRTGKEMDRISALGPATVPGLATGFQDSYVLPGAGAGAIGIRAPVSTCAHVSKECLSAADLG
jgi:hypothetical protein